MKNYYITFKNLEKNPHYSKKVIALKKRIISFCKKYNYRIIESLDSKYLFQLVRVK